MRKNKLLLWCIGLFTLSFLNLNAQSPKVGTTTAAVPAQVTTQAAAQDTTRVKRYVITLDKAGEIIRNSSNLTLQQAVSRKVAKLAKAGNPQAMHLMGLVLTRGVVVEKNLDIARKWFVAANKQGYLKSAYNLAMMYRLGFGVPQDFNKAYRYLIRAGQQGDPQAWYGRGYFLYKGLGCTQSYADALKYFQAAADKGHPRSMYILGLMYRNGYGVARDITLARQWLSRAATLREKDAMDEMTLHDPENPIQSTRLKVASATRAGTPDGSMRKVKHAFPTSVQLAGVYSGTLVTYDYSGQHVISEKPLQLTIEPYGAGMIARWKEDTLTEVSVECHLSDTALVFTNAYYSKTDRYSQSRPIEWRFVQATLDTRTDNGAILLTGNLQLYSPITREPEKPMYLSLCSSSPVVQSGAMEESASGVLIYPNPFVSQLFISFEIPADAPCTVSMYSLFGSKMYENKLGTLTKGKHHLTLPVVLPSGTYTIRLVYGDKTYSTMVIKK